VFRVTARLADGTTVTPVPAEVSMVHGVSLGDPPLPRSIGVARADNSVAIYFERGTPLPCRKTFTHRTVERIDPRSGDFALRVPIVQGDFPLAHLCRLVGVIEIAARQLKAPLPTGSIVELTIEVDRGGALSAKASVPAQELLFEHVESLVAPEASLDAMNRLLSEQAERGNELRRQAFQTSDRSLLSTLGEFDDLHAEARADLLAAGAGDLDAAEKARRALIDADGLLGDLEARAAWPELTSEAYEEHSMAAFFVEAYGTDAEKRSLSLSAQGIERGLRAKNPKEIERQLRALRMLHSTCYLRSPGAWSEQLDYLSANIDGASDPRKAQTLVAQGRKAETKGHVAGVEKAVRELWQLFPTDERERARSFDSGVK
jgi:molecular chaperone DnaK